jgi:hypothetical protein
VPGQSLQFLLRMLPLCTVAGRAFELQVGVSRFRVQGVEPADVMLGPASGAGVAAKILRATPRAGLVLECMDQFLVGGAAFGEFAAAVGGNSRSSNASSIWNSMR